jgi:tRNA threonylcarbamoyladenosine biosynthesis protein TsaE
VNRLVWQRLSEDSIRCRVASEEETRAVGHVIAPQLDAGDVLALIGDLGAGKTRFAKAIAESMGVPVDEVNSPTFTLVQEYAGRLPIRHCDTYRLKTAEEFADLSLDELFARDGIALVEWADRVDEYLPRDRLEVRIGIDSPDSRTFEIRATGRRSRKILSNLMDAAV